MTKQISLDIEGVLSQEQITNSLNMIAFPTCEEQRALAAKAVLASHAAAVTAVYELKAQLATQKAQLALACIDKRD